MLFTCPSNETGGCEVDLPAQAWLKASKKRAGDRQPNFKYGDSTYCSPFKVRAWNSLFQFLNCTVVDASSEFGEVFGFSKEAAQAGLSEIFSFRRRRASDSPPTNGLVFLRLA